MAETNKEIQKQNEKIMAEFAAETEELEKELSGVAKKMYLESKSKKYICEYNGGSWISENYGDKDNNGSCECPLGQKENDFGLCV